MELKEIKKKMDNLVEELLKHDKLYNEERPTIIDIDYDKKYVNLLELELKYPEFMREDSPSQRIVFDFVTDLEKVKHSKPMLSLKKGTTGENIKKYIKDMNMVKKIECIIREYKLDGLTIVLKYQDGKLKDAITRGNGIEGERVIHTIKTIKTIPKEIPFKGYIELRGEALISYEDFERINQDGKYSNCRNLASGSVRQLNSKVAASRNLKLLIFEIENVENVDFKTDLEKIKFIEKLGFNIVPYKVYYKKDFEQLIYDCEHFEEERNSLSYPIDGLVLKVNNLEVRKILGSTNKYPRWALAFKFPSKDATTILRRIDLQVGRTGKITPVAIFDTIEIGGTNISRATISNVEQIIKKDLRLLDTILIARAKDVTPNLIKCYPELRKGHELKIEIPTKCPACGGEIKKKGTDLFCINDDCERKIVRQLIHFCSREAMNIKGLGKSIINTLVEKNYIENIPDIYNLKNIENKLIELPKFGQKKVDKLLIAIENSKSKPLTNVITALGIPQLGVSNSKTLAAKYQTMDNLIIASKKENFKEELLSLQDIGKEVASCIVNFFFDQEKINIINSLKNIGFKMEEEKTNNINVSNKLENKTFVITGTFSKERKVFEELIEQNGGKATKSVSKKTSYVLVGDKPGFSKIEKAQELNTKVLKEDEFMDMLI